MFEPVLASVSVPTGMERLSIGGNSASPIDSAERKWWRSSVLCNVEVSMKRLFHPSCSAFNLRRSRTVHRETSRAVHPVEARTFSGPLVKRTSDVGIMRTRANRGGWPASSGSDCAETRHVRIEEHADPIDASFQLSWLYRHPKPSRILCVKRGRTPICHELPRCARGGR